MPSLTITHPRHDGDTSVQRVFTARDDVVEEREIERGVFELVEGPFRSYRREVNNTTNGVVETITYRLAIPWFTWAFALPVRHALRHRPATRRQPWWAPGQRLDARASTVLGTLAAAAVLTGYLGTLLGQSLTYVADDFDLSRSDQGVVSAMARIGTLLAIAVVVIADRSGRRRVAVLATAVGGLGSLVIAVSPGVEVFVVAQIVMRTFSAALGTVVLVYVVEEMPAGARAYALSLLGMASALGAGMVLWVLPFAEVSTGAWRILYLPPALAVALAVSFRRNLPESRWFGGGDENATLAGRLRPMAVLAVITFLVAFYLAPADQFRNEYLRDERGFEGLQISLFVLTTATPGGIGLLIAGRVADSVGRKVVLAAATIVGLGALTIVFNVSGPPMWLLAFVAAVVSSGLLPSLGVFRGELFPTNVRNRAVGWISAAGVAGAVSGLALTGWLSDRWDAIGPVIALLFVAPVAALAIAVALLPETRGRDLADLNPEDA